ncbi:MAG: NAD(P)-binding domain-containing protein, partial [Methylocella sp.]
MSPKRCGAPMQTRCRRQRNHYPNGYQLPNMRILFIGGGNMATALVGGLLKRGLAASDIRVVEVSEDARHRLKQAFGVATQAGLDDA